MTPPDTINRTKPLHVGDGEAFNNKSGIFRAPHAAVLLIDIAFEVEIGLNNQDDFLMKF